MCVANLVFTVMMWKMARDERKASGEALSVPRGRPEKPGGEEVDARKVAASMGIDAEEFDAMLDMAARLRKADA